MPETRPRIQGGPRNPRATPYDIHRDEEALLGQVIDGRYRVEAIIGRGGMGVVYRGEHVSIRRKVAIKILHHTLAVNTELRGRFEREAMAIGRIDHPNCLRVYDNGAIPDGSLFLVMEYLQGDGLGEVLEKERFLDPTRAMHILRHVLRGLEHMHSVGVVHRDLKLDNVFLIDQEGDRDFAKILDFGIAKTIGAEVDDGVKLTQAGIAFGTPLYMAPEQALGNPIDGRADIYAASVMAYEMITGRPPFYSDDKIELLSMHTTREVPPMRELMPKGAHAPSPPIENLIRRGLAKRPADRFASAGEFIVELDVAMSQTAVENVFGIMEPTGARPLVTITGSSTILPSEPTPPPQPAPLDLLPGVPRTGAVMIEAPRPPPPTPRLRSIWIYVAGLLVAAAIGVGIAVATRSTDDGVPAKLDPNTAAGAAAAELDKGNFAGAIRILEAVKDKIQTDPLALLQYGHALSATRDYPGSIAAYDKALTLAPRLEADEKLRSNLNTMITEERDPGTVGPAFRLLLTRTKVPDVKARLLAAAVDQDIDRRAAVIPVVEELHLGDTIDWLVVYTLDLEQATTCDRRKKAVAKLRALGDARAIPALERAMVRKGGKGKKLINQCLMDDASQALTYLRGLSANPARP